MQPYKVILEIIHPLSKVGFIWVFKIKSWEGTYPCKWTFKWGSRFVDDKMGKQSIDSHSNLGILVVRHCRNHSGVAFISIKLESCDGIYYFLEYSHDQLVSFFFLATRTDHLLKNRPYYKVLFVLSYPVAFFFFILIIWLFRVLAVACGIYLVLQPGNEPQAPCIWNPEDLLPGPPGKCPHLF